jgi:hypothetical protein
MFVRTKFVKAYRYCSPETKSLVWVRAVAAAVEVEVGTEARVEAWAEA